MMHSGAGGGLREKTKTGGFLLQRVVDASKRERFLLETRADEFSEGILFSLERIP